MILVVLENWEAYFIGLRRLIWGGPKASSNNPPPFNNALRLKDNRVKLVIKEPFKLYTIYTEILAGFVGSVFF